MSTEDTPVKSGDDTTALAGIETWEEYYDSPDAKIILVSSDKVGFRVDAHYLKRKSGFIKDMLEIPSGQPLELSPINLEHSSKVVRLFIEFALAQSPPLVQVVMEDFQGLVEICDRFQADEVVKTTIFVLKAAVEQRPLPQGLDPFAVFKLAALRDEIELARSAILAFGHSMSLYYLGQKPASLFDGIPVRYATALLLAACRARQTYTQESDVEKHGWDHVSRNFAVE